ncbi:MAG: hypothetical protein RSC13_06865 [Clostridium sp.]
MKTKQYRRIAASCMAVVLCSMNLYTPVYAAAPRVQVDETMYINTDYYGKETQVNVVKGCTANGVTDYTDYGVYDKVVNMTNQTAPVMGAGTLSWQLPEGNKRFYYQCTMPKGTTVLPWTFDVSYKLNGMEADAAKLGGVSGLVEIHIKATPNKQANAYYKNNMMLSVVIPVDMGKCYSVDAPGSQLQAVGNNTIVAFAALPGEEGDYTVRIGSDYFENTGVMMMMVPGTVSALDHVKDLKEAKDTWREDGNKMYEGVDELLKTMESMKTEVTQVKGGLGSWENARSGINGNRKQIESLSTQALADLLSVTEQTTAMVPYLDTAQRAVSDINDNVDTLTHTMERMQDELDTLYGKLNALRKSLDSTSREISAGITPEEQKAMAGEIQKQTAMIQQLLEELKDALAAGGSGLNLTEEDLMTLEDSLEHVDSFRSDGENDGVASDSEADREEELQMLSDTGYQSSVAGLIAQIQAMLGKGESVQKSTGAVIRKINSLCSSIGSTGDQTSQTVYELREVTVELINLIDDSRVLIDTVDGYVPSMLDALGATEELTNRLAAAMEHTHAMLSLIHDTLIGAGDSLDAGTKDTLNGMMDMLDKNLKLLDHVTTVRTAGSGMKSTLDEQLDQFEDENGFLNMDPEADMVSFTSAKNPSPHSLQMIVRTDEISADNGKTVCAGSENNGENGSGIVDLEKTEKETVNPFVRMWQVIVKIFKSVAEIFKDR